MSTKTILAALAVGITAGATSYLVHPLVGIAVAIPLGFVVGWATADY